MSLPTNAKSEASRGGMHPFVSVNTRCQRFLVQASRRQDTGVVKTLRRSIPLSAAIVVIVGVSSLGLRYSRSQMDCKRLSAAFGRQVENIREDVHVRLKIGTKKADVARFFAEHGIPFTLSESEARGTLRTSGCAPFGCGSDSALIGVSVRLGAAGAVTEEPTVVSLYTDCL